MCVARISSGVAELLSSALVSSATLERYWAHVAAPSPGGCRLWTGAVSGGGHGRFWLGTLSDGRSAVVLAHRFGFGLRVGFSQLMGVPAVRHLCDNPLCQSVEHLRAGDNADNAHDWATRRHTPGSPLRDTRGARGRALALRAAARDSGDVMAAAEAGLSALDRDQPPLLDLDMSDHQGPG